MSWPGRVAGYVSLSRPVNAVIAAGAVFTGAFLGGSLSPHSALLLACISAMLIAGGANALNDCYDLPVDAVNRPHRPLPSGRVGRRGAFLFAALLLACGVVVSLSIHLYAFLLASATTLLLILYSVRLKRMPFWGNIAVSSAAAAAFVYGGASVSRVSGALIPAGFAFLFHLGREIIKDVEDEEGDRKLGLRTLPLVVGPAAAMRIAIGVFSALIVATFLPFLFGVYSLTYLLMVIGGVDAVLAYVLLRLRLGPSRAALGQLSTLLKADMVVALLILYLTAQ